MVLKTPDIISLRVRWEIVMSKKALEAKNRFNAPQTQESLFEPIFHASAFTFPAFSMQLAISVFTIFTSFK
jgi:hypothetical protein